MLAHKLDQEDAVEILGELEGAGLAAVFGVIPFVVKPFGKSEPHAHQSEETWIVRAGQGQAVIDERRIALSMGDRLVVPSNALHHIENDGPAPLAILSFWWKESHVDS